MNGWGYYKMVRIDNGEESGDDKRSTSSFDNLKEFVQKYKYAIMDEDDEIVDWYTTYEQAEKELLMMVKSGEDKWYIKDVTEEMRDKVINA